MKTMSLKINYCKITISLVFLLFILMTGCIFQPATYDSPVNVIPHETVSPVQPAASPAFNPDLAAKEKAASIAPFLSYKKNMTFWQKKLPTQILEIIDPNAPHSGMTPDEIKTQMILDGILIPSDEVFAKLNVSQPTGDLVAVKIVVNSSASTKSVDPYVIKIIGKAGNEVDAWVELNSLEKIASLDEVKWVDSLGLFIHQGNYRPA
jgi:hypothetical protein